MGALRCVDFESAYRCIHWKSLILIVGMLPFFLALQRTGGQCLVLGRTNYSPRPISREHCAVTESQYVTLSTRAHRSASRQAPG
ncbi:hypothetical protein JWG43_16900 [Desulfobulbus alkaliphilus]|nr:hypothetical protein [Desulfobulbus alkaliphilus]MBM9538752.1 hypothetical protein [Desulfobulbus alkaliphilus]